MWRLWHGGARVCVSDPRVLPGIQQYYDAAHGRAHPHTLHGRGVTVLAETEAPPVAMGELLRLQRLKDQSKEHAAGRQKRVRVPRTTIIGCDESGGQNMDDPIVSCVAYVPPDVYVVGCDDSKRAGSARTQSVAQLVLSCPRVCVGVGVVFPEERMCDVYFAKRVAHTRAVVAFMKSIEGVDAVDPADLFLLLDGAGTICTQGEPFNYFAGLPAAERSQADAEWYEVAAASTVATWLRRNLRKETSRA